MLPIKEQRMVELRGPEDVEVKIDRTASGWSLWVNVNGTCMMRIYNLPSNTVVEDHRNDAAD